MSHQLTNDATFPAGLAAPGRRGSSPAPGQSAAASLERFLAEPSPAKALRGWLGPLEPRPGVCPRKQVAQRLTCDIAAIDRLLNRQVNALLHHPALQKL